MRQANWIGAALLVLAAAANATADETAERAAEVRRLVRLLNAPTVQQRDAAEQELLGLGPAVLDELPEPNERMPAEVRHRLERIRQQIERADAQAAVAATTVTLKGEQLPVANVLRAIEQQTGNRLRLGEGAEPPPIDVQFDKTPFWQALDAVLDRAQLDMYLYAEDEALLLIPRPTSRLPTEGRVSYAGPFRFEPTEIVAIRDLDTPASKVLKLQLQIAWEPRLQPIMLRQPLARIAAFDAQGKPLPVVNPEANLQIEVQPGMRATELELPFQLPSRSVERIARLKGELAALVPGRVETFRFDNIAEAQNETQRRGGVIVTLEGVRQNNDLWAARVRIGFGAAAGALASHRTWIDNNLCYLVDAEGNKYENLGLESTLRTEDEVGYAYLFALPDGPQGLSLVYETPAAIVELPVEYELESIPLP